MTRRPTVAQLAYGSATVVCSTIAMVLLSRTESGPGVPVIAVSALILGVFVAMSVPARKQEAVAEPAPAEEAAPRVPAQAARDAVYETLPPAAREPAGP